jgi:hypothetical protein
VAVLPNGTVTEALTSRPTRSQAMLASPYGVSRDADADGRSAVTFGSKTSSRRPSEPGAWRMPATAV